MKGCLNVWTPIKGVNINNTLRYIPNSHRINDKKIKIQRIDSKDTKKFSSGHKVGLLYKEMIIKQGVNLNNQKPLIVPEKSSAVFTGDLVHGSAINKSNKIRFSYDFRIIRKKDYKKKYFTNKNFASNSDYFIDL